uniref:Sulfatase N-terminal domain-containing protein n=1 Tax=Streptomyces avermitilis TaxID=33903 RepID=A0A499VLR1_STRAX|nr:hypothetical protein SAVMC3_25080 [Streptomyces avermitilis]
MPESDPDPAVPDPSTPDAAVPDPDTPDAAVPDPDTPDAAVPDPDTPDSAPARPGWRGKHPDAARVLAWTATGIAVALVLFALLVPNDLARFTPSRFVRIPAEGILGAALLLVLPPKPRRILAVVGGVGLGLLTILKFLDMGFYWSLERPFDLVLDWVLLDDAESFLKDSIGGGGALAVMIGAIALAVAVIALMTWSVVRLTRLMASRRHFAGRTLLVLGTAWMTCSVLTLEVAGVPVASRSAATLLENRAHAVRAGIKDGQAFARQASVDAFADTPSDQLLTGLRGKDVIFAFIESYGRSAIDDPAMTEPINETLTAKTKELSDAGYSSQSGWLRSPVAGAGSWLAHSTFLSGLWIKNQQRYRNLTSGNRMTLTEAFRRTDAWRTVGIMPGVTRAWPEGKFFGLDHIYDSRELGYQGPKFSWSPVPDQYSLAAFERLEHGKKHSKPLMSEIILTSSHNPWAPSRRRSPRTRSATARSTTPSTTRARIPRRCGRTRRRCATSTARPSSTRSPASSTTSRSTATRTPCWSSSATTSPTAPSRATRPAVTCRSRSSRTTRAYWTGSRTGAGRTVSSPPPTPRSGGWTPSATAS